MQILTEDVLANYRPQHANWLSDIVGIKGNVTIAVTLAALFGGKIKAVYPNVSCVGTIRSAGPAIVP